MRPIGIIIHLKKLPTPSCSNLNSGVIRWNKVMKFHFRAFSSNHVTKRALELLNIIYLSDFRCSLTSLTLFHYLLISTVGQAEGLSVNGRIPATHQYTCTKGTQVDYFLPRDAAEKIWSFWNRHQSPKSPFPSTCLVPGFLAHSRINF